VCRAHDRELKIQTVRSRPNKPEPVAEPAHVVVRCEDCGIVLYDGDAPFVKRPECGACGSTRLSQHFQVSDRLSWHESVGVRARDAEDHEFRRLRTGDDYTRDLEAWGTRHLDIDERADRYEEVISLWDETLIESRARLSDHQD
jgi:hypothetical protein